MATKLGHGDAVVRVILTQLEKVEDQNVSG